MRAAVFSTLSSTPNLPPAFCETLRPAITVRTRRAQVGTHAQDLAAPVVESYFPRYLARRLLPRSQQRNRKRKGEQQASGGNSERGSWIFQLAMVSSIVVEAERREPPTGV